MSRPTDTCRERKGPERADGRSPPGTLSCGFSWDARGPQRMHDGEGKTRLPQAVGLAATGAIFDLDQGRNLDFAPNSY